MQLSDEMKVAAQMGMRAGVEMAIACLEATIADKRSNQMAPIGVTLNIAVGLLRKKAAEQWPEGSA